MDKGFLSSWFQDSAENFATNIWKIAPFRVGNRQWLMVLVKGYLLCLAFCLVLACVLNSIEGDVWSDYGNYHSKGARGVKSYGDTALDECLWFVVTTVHGIAFNEFNARGVASRLIAMSCVSIGYWFIIFLLSIVMLSNLPGEKLPSLSGVMRRLVSAVWPSYMVFLFITVCVGSMVGPYVSNDPYGKNEWPTGIYFMWTVVHRMPYGDIYPDTPFGRTMTASAAVFGLLYMPYALALVAVRCPTVEQHESLLGHLRKHPENALGRGYVVPEGSMREIVMEEYTPDGVI